MWILSLINEFYNFCVEIKKKIMYKMYLLGLCKGDNLIDLIDIENVFYVVIILMIILIYDCYVYNFKWISIMDIL